MKLSKFALIAFVAIFAASCGDKAKDQNNDEASNNETSDTITAPAASYTIDTEASLVDWKGSVINVYYHTGNLGFNSGTITTENGAITGGEFSVNMTEITTTDSNYKPDHPAEELVAHLAKDDFFNTAEFPEATFKITSTENGVVKGDLTIRGNTNEETVENLVIEEKDGALNATGTLTFDRQKYNVSWKHYMKDYILSNDIELKINISAKAG